MNRDLLRVFYRPLAIVFRSWRAWNESQLRAAEELFAPSVDPLTGRLPNGSAVGRVL